MLFISTDLTISNYKAKWAFSCPNCQNERIITYAQKWNILKGNSNANCRKCQIELGLLKINISGLISNKKQQSRKRKKNSNFAIFYNTLFETEEKRKQRKENQKLAKLGKTGELANNWQGGKTPEKKQKRQLKNKQYIKKRLKNDRAFYAIRLVRNRVWSFMKNKNIKKYNKKLGCNFKTFKEHLEKQFQPGMSWNNYGEWHIDHIFPLSIAIKISEEKFLESCRYTNLQPLWAIDNLKKSNKIC